MSFLFLSRITNACNSTHVSTGHGKNFEYDEFKPRTQVCPEVLPWIFKLFKEGKNTMIARWKGGERWKGQELRRWTHVECGCLAVSGDERLAKLSIFLGAEGYVYAWHVTSYFQSVKIMNKDSCLASTSTSLNSCQPWSLLTVTTTDYPKLFRSSQDKNNKLITVRIMLHLILCLEKGQYFIQM